MNEIITGQKPERTQRRKSPWIDELIDVALDVKGEWVAMHLSPDTTMTSVNNMVRLAVSRRFCDVSVRDNVAYLRFYTDEEG